MNTHDANVVPNRTRTKLHRSLSTTLIATFTICVLSCAPHCAADGPLIKPAKWGLKWPWQKKKTDSVDPFNEVGASDQRDLATSITGEHYEAPPYSPPAIKVANGYAGVPGSAAPYPWPKPVDSNNPRYAPAAVRPPAGDLYPNAAYAAAGTDTTIQPASPATTAPVTPAPNGGNLYPQTSRSRVAGTSVTVPTPNPAAWGGPQYAATNNGSLYGGSTGATSQPTMPTIVPNYARTNQPQGMRVTTITPATGRARHAQVANEAQRVAATGPAMNSPISQYPPPPPSSRLSQLPERQYAAIEAEPTVPRKPIVPPQPAPVNTTPPQRVARVAAAAVGVPAAARNISASGVQEGPYFVPESRPNYDDQYGWQTGSAKSSRRSWGGPSFDAQVTPGVTRPASANATDSAKPPVVPATPVNPTVLPTQSSTPPATTELPPLSPPTVTPPAAPTRIDTPNPLPQLPLPLPPLSKATEQIKQSTANAIGTVQTATAAVGDSISNMNSRVELAAHNAVGQVQQAASAVLSTPVNPAPAASPVQRTAGEVDMTSEWQPPATLSPTAQTPAPTILRTSLPPQPGPAAQVAPATPDMTSQFPMGQAVAPAVPNPGTPVPRLDGSFRPGQVDQSIWGNQERQRRPTQPFVQRPPAVRPQATGLQTSANQDIPPDAPGLAPPPQLDTTPANPPNPALGDLDQASQVIAVVGDQSILASDLLWQINQLLKPYIGKAPEEELNQQRALLMEKMLPRLVENKLVYLDFLRTVPPGKMPEIRKQVIDEFNKSKLPDLMKKAKVQSPAQMDAKLRELGSSLEKQQQMFLEQIVGRQMVQQNVDARSEVTHDEMLDYYRQNGAEYDIEAQARWERLMMRWDQFPTRKEAEAALGQLGNEILRGAQFKSVAKRSSQGPRAADGGFYDWTKRQSLKSEVIDGLLFTLPVGRMSKIIQDDEGAHIIRVVERRDAGRVPFQNVQSKITDAIQEQRFKAEVEVYLAKLKQQTTVWTAFDK